MIRSRYDVWAFDDEQPLLLDLQRAFKGHDCLNLRPISGTDQAAEIESKEGDIFLIDWRLATGRYTENGPKNGLELFNVIKGKPQRATVFLTTYGIDLIDPQTRPVDISQHELSPVYGTVKSETPGQVGNVALSFLERLLEEPTAAEVKRALLNERALTRSHFTRYPF